MKTYLLINFCLISAMCVMVTVGIKVAEEGIHQMKYYDNNKFSHLSLRQEGNHQSASEYDPCGHDLEAKQNRLEKINAFNLFAFLGNKFSETVSNTVNKFIIFITG